MTVEGERLELEHLRFNHGDRLDELFYWSQRGGEVCLSGSVDGVVKRAPGEIPQAVRDLGLLPGEKYMEIHFVPFGRSEDSVHSQAEAMFLGLVDLGKFIKEYGQFYLGSGEAKAVWGATGGDMARFAIDRLGFREVAKVKVGDEVATQVAMDSESFLALKDSEEVNKVMDILYRRLAEDKGGRLETKEEVELRVRKKAIREVERQIRG